MWEHALRSGYRVRVCYGSSNTIKVTAEVSYTSHLRRASISTDLVVCVHYLRQATDLVSSF